MDGGEGASLEKEREVGRCAGGVVEVRWRCGGGAGAALISSQRSRQSAKNGPISSQAKMKRLRGGKVPDSPHYSSCISFLSNRAGSLNNAISSLPFFFLYLHVDISVPF